MHLLSDLKAELTPGGEVTLNVWRCIQHMLNAKERMYRGWLVRWRDSALCELCRADNEVDWDYISMTMNS